MPARPLRRRSASGASTLNRRTVRRTLLIVTIVFILGLGLLTVIDIADNGLTPLDVVAIMILGFFSVAILGALRAPPRP